MQAGNVYRPTEDTAGQHRQLLTALADTMLQHAKHVMQAASVAGECCDIVHRVSSCAALGCTGWAKLHASCICYTAMLHLRRYATPQADNVLLINIQSPCCH